MFFVNTGINVSAVSIQNEPNHEAYTYPSMTMTFQHMTDILKILGPKMAEAVSWNDFNL